MHHVQALLVGLETLATALPAIVKKYPLMANMNMLAQPELGIPFVQTQCTQQTNCECCAGPTSAKKQELHNDAASDDAGTWRSHEGVSYWMHQN